MATEDTIDWLSPMEMAARCEVSAETLRYYEREGLLEPVKRNSGNQRRYSTNDIMWVQVLRCLRMTAMPIREMKRFAELVRLGDVANAERVELLQAHRAEVLKQRSALDDALAMIDHKIEVYTMVPDEAPTVDTNGITTTPTLDGRGARGGSTRAAGD